MIKERLIASFLHFIATLVLVSVLAFFVFFVWYEFPFYSLYSVMGVFGLLVIIDLILGPLCTFIVYKKGKKTLKTDLLLIVSIQLLALLYGAWSIYKVRPAWLVHEEGTKIVYAISPSMLKTKEGESEKVSILKQNWLSPKIMFVKKSYGDIPNRLQYEQFEPYSEIAAKDECQQLKYIKDFNEEFYNNMLVDYPDVTCYLPLVASSTMTLSVVLLNEKGGVIDIVLPPQVKN